ncbi:uncharacterized protein A1O9_07371 [Exophiala aquamarina CBS 119918]|uniref:Carboxylic ester hydrolase n=1 Tax=Exophiala aquamarina CBS 119918 TaxID=1182545 RepID=A0A072PBE4_9EURO|nr:uncharacterized protein A1O9_07371 [Exophiala aquamarina CBS 119918]KEF57181.1 hypothetical protein A1O9_07371 [Exophiala aquamarina CBS 119918]
MVKVRATQCTSHSYVLKTPHGSLKGLEQRDLSGKAILHRFTKVPYALPPVGELRWRRPQPLPSNFAFDKSGEPGDYTEFGPVCPQPAYDHTLAQLDNPDAAPPVDNVQDEDCLYVNIWVPASPAPEGGWPVQFQIHGGWLQIGDAMQQTDHDPYDLLADTTPRIIVAPTYRLNLFGFLAGEELASLREDPSPSNYGLWDQRVALEWTAKYISHFGGDPKNITVGGLSAGANSTFFQLHYDSLLPPSQRLIRRIYLWSNAVAIQPNRATSPVLTAQFDDLCSLFSIPTTASAHTKLALLRKVPSADLVAAISKLKIHTFRSSTDNDFIPDTFLSSLHSGSFTTRLFHSGVSVLLGEVSDEKELYKLVNPPSTHSALQVQLANYYPKAVCDALVRLYDIPAPHTPSATPAAYAEVFSQIVADGQVHASLRGLTHILLNPPRTNPAVRPLPPSRVHRYRISWRAAGLDAWLKPEVKVCHGGDMPIWWASGWRADFTGADKAVAKQFLSPFGDFLYGRDVSWGRSGGGANGGSEDRLRWLDADGKIHEDHVDELWARGMQIWDAVWEAQKASVARDTELDSRL